MIDLKQRKVQTKYSGVSTKYSGVSVKIPRFLSVIPPSGIMYVLPPGIGQGGSHGAFEMEAANRPCDVTDDDSGPVTSLMASRALWRHKWRLG